MLELNLNGFPSTNYEYSGNWATIINSDCGYVLSKIPSGSIDLILTDPPYNINYAEWDEFLNIDKISSEWYRVLKPNGSVFCFSGWSFVCEVIQKFDKRFKLNDWIVYDRIKGRGATKRLVSTREDILWYTKSDNWIFNKEIAYSTIKKKTSGLGLKNGKECRALSNVWTDISPIVPWSPERVKHPTQKPIQLGDRILSVFSTKNSTVLDCYAGSGSFGISAFNNQCNFIGIEKDENFFNLINIRFEEYISKKQIG
jgi:site-specific DNA-methyltransferase (adenine-specific)